MEGARIISVPFTGGAFRHGPMEMIGRESTAVLFRADDNTAQLTDKLAADLSELGAAVVVISDSKPVRSGGGIDVTVPRIVSANHNLLYPLLSSFVHEKILYYSALALGMNPGHFRYGSKITTVE